MKDGLAAMINAKCDTLREKVLEEFSKSGFYEKDIRFSLLLRVQYMGQLRDLEVNTGLERLEGAQALDGAIDSFEGLYAKVYARAARSPELGFIITQVVVSGKVDVEKPVIPTRPLKGESPPSNASKGERDVFWGEKWFPATVWEMEHLEEGNRLQGPAIVESPATTMVVPPEASVYLDEHRIFHLAWE
jgi:acetone carboxylase beta subunit